MAGCLLHLGLIGLTTGTGLMQWTVRLKARTNLGKVKTTELVTISRVAEYAAHHQGRAACGVPQPLN